jgi:aldehyde:ferredoxin oxidoreductase
MISGQRLAEEYLVKNDGCVSCPIRCGRVVELDGKTVKGPEYEILCLMGSNLLIDDLDAIIRWNYELDLLGMDTITVGNLLGFAMPNSTRKACGTAGSASAARKTSPPSSRTSPIAAASAPTWPKG